MDESKINYIFIIIIFKYSSKDKKQLQEKAAYIILLERIRVISYSQLNPIRNRSIP